MNQGMAVELRFARGQITTFPEAKVEESRERGSSLSTFSTSNACGIILLPK